MVHVKYLLYEEDLTNQLSSLTSSREELPACCPDEHELRHLGPFDDEHPASMQLPGAHEPTSNSPQLCLHTIAQTSSRVGP